jgi:hypothetical protein
MTTMSLASWDDGTVAQEVSATARMTTTTEFDLNSTSRLRAPSVEPALSLDGYSQRRTRAL